MRKILATSRSWFEESYSLNWPKDLLTFAVRELRCLKIGERLRLNEKAIQVDLS